MADKTGIEWTDATWNPTTGCTPVSAGCDHCYAQTLALGKLAKVYGARLPVVDTPENRDDTFSIRLWPERLAQPGKWREPRMVFVNSMSDLFHRDVPEPFLRSVFEVMIAEDRHTYQALTKRPARAARFVRHNMDLFPSGEVPSHIWMGTSVENQDLVYRVRQLLDVPAAVRFLSCEPLLGPLDIDEYLVCQHDMTWSRTPDADGECWTCDGCGTVRLEREVPSGGGDIQVTDVASGRTFWAKTEILRDRSQLIKWVIGGGESGAGHRKPDPAWARSLRDQCAAAGVPFFWKQWGGHTPKAGGRLLDGVEHNAFPVEAAHA